MTSVVDAITAWLILTNFRRADDDKQLQTAKSGFCSCCDPSMLADF